jgi:hypothetical protein
MYGLSAVLIQDQNDPLKHPPEPCVELKLMFPKGSVHPRLSPADDTGHIAINHTPLENILALPAPTAETYAEETV